VVPAAKVGVAALLMLHRLSATLLDDLAGGMPLIISDAVPEARGSAATGSST
jgi:hypothetical protein